MLKCSICGNTKLFKALKPYLLEIDLDKNKVVKKIHGIRCEIEGEPYIPGSLSCKMCGSTIIKDMGYVVFVFSPSKGPSKPLSYKETEKEAKMYVASLREYGLPAFYSQSSSYEKMFE